MPEVEAHLVPRDGLTNSSVRFIRLEAPRKGSGATVVFGFFDDDGDQFGEYELVVLPSRRKGSRGSIDELGSVEDQRELMTAAARWIMALKLLSVLSARMAILLNSLSLQKKFSIK